MFKLVIQDDEGKTTIVPLIRDEITIGRKEGNTIRLTERNVSRRHARILRNNGEVHIEDLGSYNGIRVNNARIAERVSLRVSDQVQIGDYKLYLKAEGLDQAADDTRTTPLERVEPVPPPAATEAMPAITPSVTPAPVIPAVPTVPPMISSQNRAVAVVDPDPGRPGVGPATQQALAALNAPSGYAKLVVLSSNFAGKEFELSRPQMIIGRTDENDIVVNHRSISRNHAKLVREPESGRYTISDLQSSNGVRVNGSDYGKVELRRGDVIDLGHVRLRFVEVGEDFVFARDAVITDVPESGGRRGMIIAVLAALVVLVAGVVVYATRAGSTQHVSVPTPDPGSGAGSDSDDQANHPSDTGSAMAAPNAPAAGPPAGTPSAPGSAAAVDEPTPAPAPPATTVKSDDIKACVELEVKQKWQELHDCAAELAVRGAKDKAIHDKADEFRQKAVRETAAQIAADKFQSSLRDGNLREAQRQLRVIGPDSVYYAANSDAFRTAETRAIEDNRRKAAQYASAHDCVALKRLQGQLGQSSTPAVTGAVAGVKCSDKAGPPEGSGRTQTAAAPPSSEGAGASGAKNPCDSMVVDDLVVQAQNQFTAGFARSALALIVKALTCKQDVRMYRYAVTYACTAHDAAAAKLYFTKVPPVFQPPLIQKCQLENITVP